MQELFRWSMLSLKTVSEMFVAAERFQVESTVYVLSYGVLCIISAFYSVEIICAVALFPDITQITKAKLLFMGNIIYVYGPTVVLHVAY